MYIAIWKVKIHDLSVLWYLFFIFFLFLLKISRDSRIQGYKRPWNRGYENTRSARSEDFQGLWMFFCCRNEQPRVRPWTNVHLSARYLQFNVTASSRNASALSDEEGITLMADRTKETAAVSTHDTSFSLRVSSVFLYAFKHYSRSLISAEILSDNFYYLRHKS